MVDDRTYTDEQVTSACDFHVDNLRQLITWRAIVPAQKGGGRGRVRLWTMSDVQRISTIASIFNAGFSLKMAHTLSYLIPVSDFIIGIFDPMVLEMNGGDRGEWFDPNKPKVGPIDIDLYIIVNNRQYVTLVTKGCVDHFGELNKDLTLYKTSEDFSRCQGPISVIPEYLVHIKDERYLKERYAKWEDAFRGELIDPKSLAWEHDPNIDIKNSISVFSRPLTRIQINLTLGVRIAVRKVLGLPVDYP